MTDTQGSTHTPGKWRASSKMEGIHILTADGVDFAAIEALVPNPEGTANAKLIEGAAELLEACELASESEECVCEGKGECLGCILSAAIKAAKG